jgi:hypothetical protein
LRGIIDMGRVESAYNKKEKLLGDLTRTLHFLTIDSFTQTGSKPVFTGKDRQLTCKRGGRKGWQRAPNWRKE